MNGHLLDIVLFSKRRMLLFIVFQQLLIGVMLLEVVLNCLLFLLPLIFGKLISDVLYHGEH